MRREGRRALVFLALAVTAVGLVGWGFLAALEGPRAAAARLETLDPRWLAAAVLAWTLSLGCQAGRWRALMASERRPDQGTLSLALWGTNAMHLALPGPAAELAASLFVSRRAGITVAAAVASAVMSRLLALGVLGAFTLVLWPLTPLEAHGEAGRWLGAAAASLAVLGLVAGTATFAPLAVVRTLARFTPMLGRLGP
ncbi:MAG: lysylphosphatidylglycerol synthase domain-containing protein, partial [Myxococcota bacterium]